MRASLIGTERERDRMRWQLTGSGVTIVGEFATVADARRSGVDAEAFIVPSVAGAEPAEARAVSSRRGASADEVDLEPLTARERQVLDRLADGLSNRAIAADLGISDQTVKFHVASITGKLGVSNRTEAVRRAIRRGLITV